MKLSIIIPYYNTPDYTAELLNVLEKQITDDVEVFLIDDGSEKKPEYPSWVHYVKLKHGGQAKARNKGLSLAKGEYIQFIDSDDLVSEDFISKILEKIPENSDLIEYSWRSLNSNGAMFKYKLNKDGDRLTNPSACTRCFKRDFIGTAKFNTNKDACEDEDFTRHLGVLFHSLKVSVIPDYLYFYRTDVAGSNVKRYKNGLCKTKRIVYYYPEVTVDRRDIVESIKEDDKTNEVILMTQRNEIPELRLYCQIIRPTNIWTHKLKGDSYRGCTIVPIPEQYGTILYVKSLHIIGGIETFVYNFSSVMDDVTLLISNIPNELRARLEGKVKIKIYDPRTVYNCDTLIMLRILDDKPGNIRYNRSVRMCHACRTNPKWYIPRDCDFIVNVSQASKDSFEDDGYVIHNPIVKSEGEALVLVSATRIPAPDKGRNEIRMRRLAEMLNENNIPFVWFNFSEGMIPDAPKGLVNMGCVMDIQPYLKKATYLVQLSDSEAWSYSILEALVNNVPPIVCDFPSAHEMGIEDGKNGYILPFDMDFDVKKLLTIPKFEYKYDNKMIINEWKKLFKKKGNTPQVGTVKIRAIRSYNDMKLNRMVFVGETLFVIPERAEQIVKAGFARYER